jgi:hypothetical protein
VLGLCFWHDLPHALAPWSRPSIDEMPCRPSEWKGFDYELEQGLFREPLEGYRTYARQAQTMIDIADLIRRRRRAAGLSIPTVSTTKPKEASVTRRAHPAPLDADELAVPRDMWLRIRPLFPGEFLPQPIGQGPPVPLEVDTEQRLLGTAINNWLDLGQVAVRWSWPVERSDPELSVGADHLFGALALALALITTRMARLYVCEDCGTLFTPKRKRTIVRWCERCRGPASHRESERRRRARRRAEALT